MAEFAKVLVRTPNWLGDAVMSTPFLKRVAERHPGAAVDVLSKPGPAGVFAGAPGVRRTLRLGTPEAAPEALRREGYEKAYVLPTSFSSAWGVFRAGVPERIGHAAELRSPLLTRAIPLDERFHYVRRYLSLLGEEGRDVSREDFHFPMQEPADLPPGPVLAVAPGSRAPARRWSPAGFAAVIDALPEREWPSVVLLGAGEDAPFAEAVAGAARRKTVNLCGKTPLPVLGGILRRCGALVANESGLMHAAWAVGTPIVVIAGPSEPRSTSPFGARVRVLQRKEIPCVPCVRNECYRLGEDHMACMKAVGPAEVLEALSAVISAA